MAVQTQKYYRKCYDDYCFSILDNSGGFNIARDNANKSCANNGSVLAEVSSKEIQDDAVSFLNEAVGNQYLSGSPVLLNALQRDQYTWYWVTEKRPAAHFDIMYQEPEYSRHGYMLQANSVPRIGASTPTTYRGYICQFSSDIQSCTFNNGRCYVTYNNESLTWFDARNRCLERGGDLASFDNISGDDGLKTLNGTWLNSTLTYWIGIRRTWWTWMNSGEEVLYSNWDNGHPSNYSLKELCLGAGGPAPRQWKWVECGAAVYRLYLCIAANPVTKTTILTPAISKSTDRVTTFPVSSAPVASSSQANSSTANPPSIAVPVGVGVGVGGGLIILIIVGVVVIIFIRRRRLGNLEYVSTAKSSKEKAAAIKMVQIQKEEAVYAEIDKGNRRNQPASTAAAAAAGGGASGGALGGASGGASGGVYASVQIQTTNQDPSPVNHNETHLNVTVYAQLDHNETKQNNENSRN